MFGAINRHKVTSGTAAPAWAGLGSSGVLQPYTALTLCLERHKTMDSFVCCSVTADLRNHFSGCWWH